MVFAQWTILQQVCRYSVLADGSVILSVAFGVRKGQVDEPLVRKTTFLVNRL